MASYKVISGNLGLVTFLLAALCFFCQTTNCQDYSSCGLRLVPRGKIFGGLQSRPGMWPWQVAIFRRTSDEGQRRRFICGGALINSRWVLSAAHCFYKPPHEKHIDYRYTIKAGEHEIFAKGPHEQERNVISIHNHPNFVASTFENDIALVELDKGVKMGPNVRSICLPRANANVSSPGEIVSVAGWGFTAKGSHSSVLLHSAFEIQTNKICKDTTRHLFNETVMFCAGHDEGGNDTCKGDSGGSTVRKVQRDGRRRWVTVGLVSWGEKCGIKGKYGYYTRVEPFVNWIQKKINGSSLSCGHPRNIPNGRISGSDFLVGFTVKYTCNEGYRMRGRSRSRCKRNGKWTKVPSCQKVECRDPGSLRNGVRRPRRKKLHYYKDKIRFRCKTNYTIIGRSALMCRSNGMWSGFKPACLAPCKDPGIPKGGVRLDHSFKHSQTVRFMCRKRNQPPSLSYLTCNNGRWNQNIPRCIADCDDPGIPANGQRRGNDFTLKNKVYFTCDRGYMRVGPEYLQCQSNRRWSDKAPICEPLSCTRPTPPANAYIYTARRRLKEKYGFNEVVKLQCNRGYRADGSPFVRCLINGWSKTNLLCPRVECKKPATPRNGERDPEKDKYVYEDRVEFRCATNYTRIGERFIICQHDKTWSKDAPRCLAPCRDPGIPAGGERLQHSFLHNNVVQFRCNRRWSMEGSHTIRCNDGQWDQDPPTCSEGCSRPVLPGNGDIYSNTRKNFYDHKNRVRFYCNRYYKLVGDEYATCRDGDWTSDPPECKRLCANPGRPGYGSFSGSEFFEGKEIRFYCYSGYDLIGSQAIRCLRTGQWSAGRPGCKRRCNNPLIQFNALISNPNLVRGGQTKHGITISFSCRPRYTLDGHQTIRCDNGGWSRRVPTCKAPCSDPGDLQYGRKYESSFLHGNQVTYTCLGRYMLDGATSLTCNNGRWDRPKPSCKAPCPDPGIPGKGNKRGYDYRHSKRVSYTCQGGTRLVGQSSSTCNNGEWSYPLPRCLEICPSLKNPKNGQISSRKVEYLSGEKATFQCKSTWQRTYDLVGNKEITCNAGKWSGEIPFCLGRCQVPSNYGAGVISSPRVTSRQLIRHGVKISFSCWDRSKLLDGDREITCNDGTWSNQQFPTCKAPCRDPAPIRNGTRRSTNFTVEYECFHGYSLAGPSRRNCVRGRWDSYTPQCLKNCPNPGPPTNGYKTGTDYTHGKRVFYGCRGRTRLRGESRLTCNNGKWSSPVPKCLEICPTPRRPGNGRYLINENGKWEYLSGDKVVYECSSGYDLVGNRERHCDRGRWNGSAPVCADRCKIKSKYTGVQFVTKPREPGVDLSSPSRLAQGFKHGTVLAFSCVGNKRLDGPSEIVCNQGIWSKDFPKCEVPCRSLGELSNGKMRGSQFRFQYECDSGYTLVGNPVIICNQGQWSSYPPRCMSDCVHPGRLSNGRVIGSDYRHGQSISFSCHYGFLLNGRNVLMCNDGIWNDTIPTCTGVCQSLVAPKNGKLLYNNFDNNALVKFQCNEGYDIIGPKMLYCRNGIWSNDPPICKGRCVDPGVPQHGRRRGDTFMHRQTVDFFCNQGYELFGESSIRCNDGNWSHPAPKCEGSCRDPGVPTGMTRKGFSLRSRSSLTYSCIPPYHISGNSVITCKDGTWSDSVPTCSDCGSALGMESRKIPDGNIRASSTRTGYQPSYGRLNRKYAWCSGALASERYLEIDFGKPYRITGVATQGSEHNSRWVETYTLKSNLAGSSFYMYREDNQDKTFIGNTDKTSVVKRKLKNPVTARRLRIYPKRQGIFSYSCMRVEIYGCDLPSDCILTGSRIVAKWNSNPHGGDIYFKAYLTSIISGFWKVELENERHHRTRFKYFPTYSDLPFVLDVPPKHEQLRVGTRVLAPWGYIYYTSTIKTGRDRYNRYRVRADDGDENYFTVDKIRLLKAPTFCN